MKSNRKNRVFAIVLAGGNGERMGRSQKQFFSLNGKPILFYSIDALLRCSFIDGIIVVVPKGRIYYAQKLISKYYKEENILVIAGGKTRRDSSCNALVFIQKELDRCDYVIFHDGVRPLTSMEMVRAVFEEAKKFGAAVLGFEALNVIAEVQNKAVVRTFNAKKMYDIQTPHCYRFDWILQAHKKKTRARVVLENTELLHAFGKNIRIVDNFYQNMKLTFPQDVIALEALLKYSEPEKSH